MYAEINAMYGTNIAALNWGDDEYSTIRTDTGDPWVRHRGSDRIVHVGLAIARVGCVFPAIFQDCGL